MTRMVSLNTKIQQLEGLHDTKDLTDWENGFVENIVIRTKRGLVTSHLSEAQIERIEELWGKHFA